MTEFSPDPVAVPKPATRNPEPMPIGPFPTWISIAGAIFGGITLLGMFGFLFIAGTNERFICNSFVLIAAIFAFGAALAASFIGGAAAFQGQLGQTAMNNAVAVSAGGGVAVLFGTFFLFHQFEPTVCRAQNTIASLTNDIQKLEGELKVYKTQDIRITPRAHNQARSLKDKIEIRYSNKDRADMLLEPTGGVFIVPRKEFDEGSSISIGTRDNSEPARPASEFHAGREVGEPPRIVLSSIAYKFVPLELQLFLNLGDK